ncbi:MAG TPA: hypothetical protein VFB12_24340 [Ktedonobacteraceae bacterium]|nr:hypothetical protein [Ktedonobacteraceae bacterium]
MQQENKGRKKDKSPESTHSELSEVWQELLGEHSGESSTPATPGAIPTLESDPWSELLHAKGIEIVDLQAVHLQISDQEVEQMLEVMQEQPAQDQPDIQGPTSK